jgi:hypothetical protein
MRNGYRFLSDKEPTDAQLRSLFTAMKFEVIEKAAQADAEFKKQMEQQAVVLKIRYSGLMQKYGS